MSKKILVLASTFPRWVNDTTPPFVLELARRLVEEGMSVDVLAPHAQCAKRKETIDGVMIYRYKYFFDKFQLLNYDGGILANLKKNKWLYLLVPLFLISQAYSLIKLVNKGEYDLVHAHWIIPQGLISVIILKLLCWKKTKILCTSHGGDLFAFQSTSFYQLKKWVLDSSDAITVVSNHMKKICETMITKKEKIHVCSMGVDLSNTFKPVDNIKRNDSKILFVGRLVEKKGVATLLEAISILIEKNLKLELLIVGEGPERKKLETLTFELGIQHCTKFLGAIIPKQLPELYSSASITVMPSIIDSQNDQEGLGLVAIEAMGCDCAVVASSLPAVKDIIDDGVNGVLSKPGDKVELANALERVLMNNEFRDQIAAKARSSVVEKYDWQVITHKYKQLISSVCS